MFVVSGKGSSGLLWTKKVKAASRLDDNLHTSISLQVVFIKHCLS
ncbi:glycine cleavage system H protein [Bacteroides heparinolyticus]|nr:glycine cleavage system H protein [Bacteroides heparinolyticus]